MLLYDPLFSIPLYARNLFVAEIVHTQLLDQRGRLQYRYNYSQTFQHAKLIYTKLILKFEK